MKTTPFQLTLKNELSRLERLSYDNDRTSFSLLSLSRSFGRHKPTKNKHFLLQFFQQVLSF